MGSKRTNGPHTFDVQAFLDSAHVASAIVEYPGAETIFSQGDPADAVIYIQKGGVKLAVVSKLGREAIVAMLGPGDFCGEGGVAGQSVRTATATALTPTTALLIDTQEMVPGGWPLKEAVLGQVRHTYIPGHFRPVADYLEPQRRFQQLFHPTRREDLLSQIQTNVDRYWASVHTH